MLGSLSRRSLGLALGGFYLLMAGATGVLVFQAAGQLKWEVFHQHQQQARRLTEQADARLAAWIATEQARGFSDYRFLVVEGEPAAGFLQRSPLSAWPMEPPIPGLMGYFQVDADGSFSTPLVPRDAQRFGEYGLSVSELSQRLAHQQTLLAVLERNELLAAPALAPKAVTLAGEAATGRADHAERRSRFLAAPASAPMESPPSILLSEAEETALQDDEAGEPLVAQATFDRLNQNQALEKKASRLGRVEDLKLESNYAEPLAEAARQQAAAPVQQRMAPPPARSERAAEVVEESVASKQTTADADLELDALRSTPQDHRADPGAESAGASSDGFAVLDRRIHMFDAELGPFEFGALDSGHLVLFRKVWREGQRIIQGALIEPRTLVRGIFEAPFAASPLAASTDLVVAFQGEVFGLTNAAAGGRYLSKADELTGELLFRSAMSAPLSDFEMIYSVDHLPAGAAGRLLGWLAAVVFVVLTGGCLALYRLGLRQIDLVTQQQDFVSSVSHELKTPLTSIRMYGEMLREGWAPEEKKAEYYSYIHDESERLSRLISNVLQLARMTRNELSLDCRPAAVAELLDGLRSKLSSAVERAGFELRVTVDPVLDNARVSVDPDAFTQIAINLVDNALKFAAGGDPRRVEVSAHPCPRGVLFSVRDFGPGVPRKQMKKIFGLFYRSENELTRETVGTGIGLALVHQLSQAMGGRADVVNHPVGAEFRVMLPRLDDPA